MIAACAGKSGVVCNCCAGSTAALLFVKNGFEILRCRSCGLVFVHPMPDLQASAELYSEEFFTDGQQPGSPVGHLDEDSGKRATWQYKLAEIVKFLPSGRLLDVGSGPGYFVKMAQENEWDAEGIDISTFASDYAYHQLGVRVWAMDFLEYESTELYDVITMWDFIEHTPDPRANLRKALDLLRPGGILALSTGNIGSLLARVMGKRWYLLSPPTHLHYFTKTTLSGLLIKAGFTVRKIAYEPRYMSIRFALARLSLLYPANRVYRFLARLVSRSPMGKFQLQINLGDVMTAYAMKGFQLSHTLGG